VRTAARDSKRGNTRRTSPSSRPDSGDLRLLSRQISDRTTDAKFAEARALDLFDEPHRHAQKMEAIGQLAGGVAHDFNNLLTVILGYGKLLLDTLDPHDPCRADVAEIHKAAISASTLTRQLLTCIRREATEPVLIDINAVVEGMQVLLGRLIGEHIAVVVNLGPKALVLADRGQIEQIILNLAVNARDAMPRGGTVTIGTVTSPTVLSPIGESAVRGGSASPSPCVTLTVTDTGSGLTSQAQAHLFEPFFTTKEPGKGTGLGLATVHGIVTRLGGTIGVRTDSGVGTSFMVCLPQADAGRAVAGPRLPTSRAPSTSEKILLVEDADGPRALLARMLRRHGYTVLVAANAAQAESLFHEDPSIALVLTDVIMPGRSGPDLGRSLLEQRPAVKVIYMSGYPDEAIVPHGVCQSGIAFLRKPFADGALLRTIRAALEA
jgi:signal transduction histidine kinase/CheY-like chemotaxis protein